MADTEQVAEVEPLRDALRSAALAGGGLGFRAQQVADVEQAGVDPADLVAADLIDKANTGARLFFAIYHHPQARELLSSKFGTKGFMDAYGAATDAFLGRR